MAVTYEGDAQCVIMAGGHEESSVTVWRWETRGSHLHIPGGFSLMCASWWFLVDFTMYQQMEYVWLEKVGYGVSLNQNNVVCCFYRV